MLKRILQPCTPECEDRRPGCHAECERYRAAEKLRERSKEKRRLDYQADELRIRGVARAQRRRNSK